MSGPWDASTDAQEASDCGHDTGNEPCAYCGGPRWVYDNTYCLACTTIKVREARLERWLWASVEKHANELLAAAPPDMRDHARNVINDIGEGGIV